MTDSNPNKSVKPLIPTLGGSKSSGGIPKLPQLHGPNLMGLKPLSVPGSKLGLGSMSKPAAAATPAPEPEEKVEETASPADALLSNDKVEDSGWDDLGDDEDINGGSTQAIAQPSPEQIAAAIAAAQQAKESKAAEAAPSEPSPLSVKSISAPETVVPAPATPAAEAASPLLHESVKGDSSIDPNANDDELKWEEEEENNGEKTQMIDAFEDEEEEPDGEKTQIQMDAYEFDPLSGKLIVEAGKTPEREYVLMRERTAIGRGQKNEVVIADVSISRHHIAIEKLPAGFRLLDLDSANGTFLNGRRIKSGQLRNNDIIEIGNLRFRFEQDGGDPDELWKGQPQVELHPNQSKPRSHANGGNVDYSNNNQNYNNAASQPAAPMQARTQAVGNAGLGGAAPAETMLERAGGGLAAPAWAPPPTISPLTSPYMMSYVGSMQQKAPTPVWAIAMTAVAGIVCLVGLIFLCTAFTGIKSEEEAISSINESTKDLTNKLESALSFYNDRRISDAQASLKEAENINKEKLENNDDAKAIIDRFISIMDEEFLIQSEMVEANTKFSASKAASQSIDQIENSLKSFKSKSEDSIFSNDIKTRVIPIIEQAFFNNMSTDIRNNAKNGKFDEARELLVKLSKFEATSRAIDIPSKVKELNKYIEDNEKRTK